MTYCMEGCGRQVKAPTKAWVAQKLEHGPLHNGRDHYGVEVLTTTEYEVCEVHFAALAHAR